MEDKIYPVAVIGSGAAGTMATLRTILNNDKMILFPGHPSDRKKSRAKWVKKIENIPGYGDYTKGIDGPYQTTLKWIQASPFKKNLQIVKNRGVTNLEKNRSGIFKLTDSAGDIYLAEHVILCTGVMDVQPIIAGSMRPIFPYSNAQTADYCVICDGHHTLGKHSGIIGHSNGAAKVAFVLHEKYGCPSMKIFTNGEKPDFDDSVLELIQRYKIEVIEDRIIGVEGRDNGKILEGLEVENRGKVHVEFLFIALGMIVYNELAKTIGANVDERGFVITDEVGETSIENLYVAGDLRAGVKKQIYTSWDTAVDSVNNINLKIRMRARESGKKLSF